MKLFAVAALSVAFLIGSSLADRPKGRRPPFKADDCHIDGGKVCDDDECCIEKTNATTNEVKSFCRKKTALCDLEGGSGIFCQCDDGFTCTERTGPSQRKSDENDNDSDNTEGGEDNRKRRAPPPRRGGGRPGPGRGGPKRGRPGGAKSGSPKPERPTRAGEATNLKGRKNNKIGVCSQI
eukprot:m.311060 g.311060  ORF g.311060 m.311060 type:complete len:180 (+) comp58951_c0_seq1:67-606(+)